MSSKTSKKKSTEDKKRSLKKDGAGCSKTVDDLLEWSSEESCDDANLTIDKTALKRMAVIDTLNVIHQCAQNSPFTLVHKDKCDAVGILWLARELIKLGFDLKLFIPDSYINGEKRQKVANSFILEELQSLGYLTTIRDHSHDDLVLLEFAKSTAGFIISNDKFRDHEQTFSSLTRDEGSLGVIRERVVRFHFVKVTQKFGRILASPRANGFLGVECILQPSSPKSMYAWDRDNDDTFRTVFAQRMCRSQAVAASAMERLNEMCEYLRLYLCEINAVQPEPLPYFNPAKNQLSGFDSFLRLTCRYKEEESRREKRERAEREPAFGGGGFNRDNDADEW